MRLLFVAALLWPVMTLADPSCEQVYWGEVYDQKLGTEYGLLLLQGVAAEGTIIAARGADRDDPDALAICPEAYTVLEAPRLMLSAGGALSKIPEDWGKNSNYYDGVVVHDPDGVGSASVSIFWDAGQVLVPIRTALFHSVSGTSGDHRVIEFDELAALFPEGDGVLFVHDLGGPVLLTHYLRWNAL